VTSDGRFAVSASHDSTLGVWDLSAIKARRESPDQTRERHTRAVVDVAMIPDRRMAISASRDGALAVWDLSSGSVIQALDGHSEKVTGVAASTGGRIVVSVSADDTLKVWDLSTGRIVQALDLGHRRILAMTRVAVTHDAQLVVCAAHDAASGKCTISAWDLTTNHERPTLQCPSRAVFDIAILSNGRQAILASGRPDVSIELLDLSTGEIAGVLRGHTSTVLAVAAAQAAPLVASASADGTVKVWDLSVGEAIHTLQGHSQQVNSVALTPDGRLAVSASHDRTLKVWDLRAGRPIATLETNAPLWRCAITSDGRTILARDDAGSVHILDWISTTEAFGGGGL
jgi:WD40 repeat protein